MRFLRLQFTDILGVIKNVEIPSSQFRKALQGDIMFDGSSIEGFVRVEESDMLLAPDLTTFQIFPWGDPSARVGRVICDVNRPDGTPFEGDPRWVLKRQVARAAELGFVMNAGMEAEFFLFKPTAEVWGVHAVRCATSSEQLFWLNNNKSALCMYVYVEWAEQFSNVAIALSREGRVIARHEEIDVADTACGA